MLKLSGRGAGVPKGSIPAPSFSSECGRVVPSSLPSHGRKCHYHGNVEHFYGVEGENSQPMALGNLETLKGTIKHRNGMDLTEAEDIKKWWQEYTELYKKDLHDPDNQVV